ncbi:MAG: glycosyltransferase family 4 protein [Candidatus Paceibacterota bacterium]
MKKVCILTSVHPAFDDRIFYKEARSLVEAGYDVTLIAQHNKNEVVGGIKIIALPKSNNRFSRIFGLTGKMCVIALKQKADIYHFHDPELLPWMVMIKKMTRVKIIYDVHENVPGQILSKYWIPKYLRGLISRVMNIFEKLSVKSFDKVIAATQSIGERFSKEKVVVIKNLPVISIIKRSAPIEYLKKIPVAIYEGAITKIRGIKQILEALDILNGKAELWLLGPFSPPSFEKEILSNPKSYIKYKGYLPPTDIYSFVKLADVGLVVFLPEPNHLESLPNKIFDYMAAGLPIVASNFPLWREIIEGNKCGICVDPLNPKEISKAIEYLINNPEEAKLMAENGIKTVSEKYNWENEAKKLLNIYEELIKNN